MFDKIEKYQFENDFISISLFFALRSWNKLIRLRFFKMDGSSFRFSNTEPMEVFYMCIILYKPKKQDN